MRYEGANFNQSTKVWLDSSGNNRHIAFQGSPASVMTVPNQFGSSQSFAVVIGSTNDSVVFGNPSLPEYTLIHVCRYQGWTFNRIIQSPTVNWISGFTGECIRCAFHSVKWITPHNIAPTTNWILSIDMKQRFLSDGVDMTTAGVTDSADLPPLSINIGMFQENSNWQIAEIIIFNVALSSSHVQEMGPMLASKYGLTTYFTGPTFNPSTVPRYAPTIGTFLLTFLCFLCDIYLYSFYNHLLFDIFSPLFLFDS